MASRQGALRDISSAKDALLLAQLALLSGVFRLALLWLPLQALVRADRRAARRPLIPWVPAKHGVERLAELASLAARATGSPCLARSLLLLSLLEARGERATLTIGVRRLPGGEFAHAWVERSGVALAERPEALARFATIVRMA
ncbi:lasso peptide biosynthesis B2 protein [bacterium]|nr:lasso peptide biosynthesis B2 protein [bacterium]